MQCQLGRGRSRLFRLPALLGARRALPGLTTVFLRKSVTSTHQIQSISQPTSRLAVDSESIVSRAGKLRALAVTTMSRAALLQRPSMQSPKSDQARNRVVRRLFAARSASFRSSACVYG